MQAALERPEALPRLLDNPIVLRSAFAKLRMPGIAIWIVVILILGVFILGATWAAAAFSPGRQVALPEAMRVAFGVIFGLQCLLLFLVGTSSIANGIASDRDTLVYEMLRMSPRPSWQIVAGYLVGMPVREHLLSLVLLPLGILAAFMSVISMERVVALYVVLYAAAVLYHLFGALTAMVIKQPRTATGLAVGAIMLYHMFGTFLLAKSLTILPTFTWALFPTERNFFASSLFGWEPPAALHNLIVLGGLSAFAWLAAVRKFDREDRPSLSKPQALAFGLFAEALILGGVLDPFTGRVSTSGSFPAQFTHVTTLYMGFACVLAVILVGTPNALLHAAALKRAAQKGGRGPGILGDASLNLLHALLATLPFGLATLALPGDDLTPLTSSLVFISSLLAVGFLLQWLKLMAPRNWAALIIATLALLWGLPIVLAIAVGAMNLGEEWVAFVGGCFPGIGLALTGDDDAAPGLLVSSGVNVVLALLFAVLSLRASARLAPPPRE